MKWVKHITKSKYDPKLMRIIKKHGIKGFGIYWAIIEWIANQLEPENPCPDLEQESRDIADFFNMDIREVDEIVKDCINEKLLQYNKETQRIECFKVLTHLDNTLSSNPQIKAILDNFNKLEVSQSRLAYLSLAKPKLAKPNKEKLPPIRKYRFYDYVLLTYDEYHKLKGVYGRDNLKQAIEKLDYYISTSPKGKAYLDHYAVFKKGGWLYKEFAKADAKKTAVKSTLDLRQTPQITDEEIEAYKKREAQRG